MLRKPSKRRAGLIIVKMGKKRIAGTHKIWAGINTRQDQIDHGTGTGGSRHLAKERLPARTLIITLKESLLPYGHA